MATILIVDDDADTARLARHWLERDGHRTSTVMTGERALEALREQRFDMVLLDVRLPGMSGFEVLRRIRSEALTDAPVVFLTITDPDDIPAELNARWLPKPFTQESLSVGVEAILHGAGRPREPQDGSAPRPE